MPRTGLAELVDRHKGNRSYSTLSKDGGGAPHPSAWHDYHIGARVPDAKNVPAVAQALHVPPAEVWLAIGVSLDYLTEDDTDPTPPLFASLKGMPVDMLTADQVSTLTAVIAWAVRVAVEH